MSGPSETSSGAAASGTRDEPAGTDAPRPARTSDDDRTQALQRSAGDPGPGWVAGGAPEGSPRERSERPDRPERGPAQSADRTPDAMPATSVLPGGASAAGAPRRSGPPRPGAARAAAGARPAPARARRARLALRRIDPWSVFLFSLVASVFLGVALVVAIAVLYSVLGNLGVTTSLNELFAEVTGGDAVGDPLLTSSRIVGGAAVLAAVNVVFLTLLATLSALLYNLCASFTGGLELTLGERD